MIKKVSSEKFSWLVEKVIANNSLLEEKPVIAGGFAVALYRAYRMFDTEYKWKQLERAFCYDDKNKGVSLMLDDFGDIDMWFFDDSPVHSGLESCWIASETIWEEEPLPDPLKGYRTVRSSVWANSYRKDTKKYNISSKNSDYIIQVIKTPISSVESLFKTFDFTNSCVAYYDGSIYYHPKLEESFEKFELTVNNSSNYKSDSMPQRVYSALRAFKYAKRFSLDFSEELADLIFNLYYDLSEFNYSFSLEKEQRRVVLNNDVYGSILIPINDFIDMKKSLEQSFSIFTKMKSFKDEYAIFLLDKRNLNGIKDFFELQR